MNQEARTINRKGQAKTKTKVDNAMALAPKEGTTFHRFPNLPIELRVMLWKEAFRVCWRHSFSALSESPLSNLPNMLQKEMVRQRTT